MKFKSWIAVLGVVLLLLPPVAFAKGGGFSGGSSSSFSSSSSRSFSSSSSSSYSKPSFSSGSVTKSTTSTWSDRSGGGYFKPSGSVSAPASSSGGYVKPQGGPAIPAAPSGSYSKPGSVATTSAKPTFQSSSGFNKNVTKDIQKEKAATSLASYQAEKGKFKAPEQTFDKTKYSSNALYTSKPVYGGYNAQTQYTTRNTYYTTNRYVTPSYAYGFGPSYGVFDTLFLIWMMDNMHTNAEARSMAYNYRNDPGYQQWQAETRKQSANNPELKAKVDSMEAELAKMKAEGVKTDPNYIPKGIPADVILSSQAMQAKEVQKPDLVFATGAVGGNYQEVGKLLKRNATNVNLTLKETTGSMENLKLLLGGQVDMAIVQSDVLAKLDGSQMATEQTIIYPEFMQLVVNSKSGIKSIKNMTNGKCSVCMPRGSGTAAAWDALVEQDSSYSKIPVINDTYGGCLTKTQKDPNVSMFMVAGLNSPVMKIADKTAQKSGSLTLASVDDNDFDRKKDKNGNKIYAFHAIPSDTYPGLQHGWLWNHSVDSLTVGAVLVVRTEWVKKYGQEAFEALTFSFLETKDDITKLVNKR